jgi:hypothetical protein
MAREAVICPSCGATRPTAADEPQPRFNPLVFGVVAATVEMAIVLALFYC